MKNYKLLLTGIFLFTCQLAIADKKIDAATPELYLHCSNGKVLDAKQVKKGQDAKQVKKGQDAKQVKKGQDAKQAKKGQDAKQAKKGQKCPKKDDSKKSRELQ